MILEKVILHVDMNNFYASVECIDKPHLKDVPMAVGGDESKRHGIVLAKNMLAKNMGVKTAEALWQARKKCPEIVFVRPNFEKYVSYSKAAKEIYKRYTDKVESFGLDECWLDVSGSTRLFGSGEEIAQEIRETIKKELNLTVSIGVSFNKIFAKLGSDMKKPDAVTVINKDDFKEKIWHLKAGELLGIGPVVQKKLINIGIFTIGDLAQTNVDILSKLLGKQGKVIWEYANGLDNSDVTNTLSEREVKSIGNSTTTARDIQNIKDVKLTFYMLAQSVSKRLREKNLKAGGIQISLRKCNLETSQHQCKTEFPINSSKEIFNKAYELFKATNAKLPLRGLGIKSFDLREDAVMQQSLFYDAKEIEREDDLEKTLDNLKDKFGDKTIKRAIFLKQSELTDEDEYGGFNDAQFTR